MTKYYLAVVTLTIGLAGTTFAQSPTPPAPTPSPSPLYNCLLSSWSPEMHIFYGSKDVITGKLGDWNAKPSDHRVMVQITQGDKAGNVRLFQRNDKDAYTVTEWSVQTTSLLIGVIDKAIMANSGVNCVGEKIKEALKKLGKGTALPDFTEPGSAAAAFDPALDKVQGRFIKTVVIFGC